MTIDERLDRLTERTQAIAESVELLVHEVRETGAQIRSQHSDHGTPRLRPGTDAENIRALARIAEIPERRLTDLEGLTIPILFPVRHQMLHVALVLGADVLPQIAVGDQRSPLRHLPRTRVIHRIFDGDFLLQFPEYPDASNVRSHAAYPTSRCPARSSQVSPLKPMVSTTSSSPSHFPTESPHQVGFRSLG